MITRPARNIHMPRTKLPLADSGSIDVWNDDGGNQPTSSSRRRLRHPQPKPTAITANQAIDMPRDGSQLGLYVLLFGLPIAVIAMTMVNLFDGLF
jgi:hypothetical protein